MTEIDEKTERLVRLAAQSNVAGILLTTQPGFAWLTGGGSNRIDGSRETGNGALLVRADGRRFVVANAIEMPRLLAEEVAGPDWQPIEYPWIEDHARPDTLARLAGDTAGGTVGADWPLPGVTPLDRAIVRARALLTPAEVERYRALGAGAGQVIGVVARQLTPGLQENAIARLVHDAAASIDARAVVVLVAADERIASFRHPIPTEKAWTQTVMIAACLQRGGLTVAVSRIVSSIRPSAELARRTDATAHVFGRLLDASAAGIEARAMFATARRAYQEAGFKDEEFRHHQGGAIGYRSREWVAHPASEERIQLRQALAWNPSITGTKIEDTLLLTEHGRELITRSPAWPTLSSGAAGVLTL